MTDYNNTKDMRYQYGGDILFIRDNRGGKNQKF